MQGPHPYPPPRKYKTQQSIVDLTNQLQLYVDNNSTMFTNSDLGSRSLELVVVETHKAPRRARG